MYANGYGLFIIHLYIGRIKSYVWWRFSACFGRHVAIHNSVKIIKFNKLSRHFFSLPGFVFFFFFSFCVVSNFVFLWNLSFNSNKLMRNFCKCFTFCIIIKPYFMYRLPAQRKFLRQSMFRTARFDNNFCFHMPNQPCTFYNPEKLKRIQFYQHRPWSIVFCFCFTLFFINAVFFLLWFDFVFIILVSKCLFIFRFIWAPQRFKSVTNDNFVTVLFFNIVNT